MKIAIIKEYIPAPAANIINTLKFAQGFFDLRNKIEILAISRFVDFMWRVRISNVHKFYGIHKNIKINYFKGGIGFFLSNFAEGNNKISNLFYYYNPFHAYLKFMRLFPKLYNFFDPEKKISKYCIKNKFDLAFCRDGYKAAYINIKNRIPTIIDLHGTIFPLELKRLFKLGKNKFFKGITTVSPFIKQHLIEKGFPEEKIFVMDNAVNLKKYDHITNEKKKLRLILNLPIDRRIILSAGKMRFDRGMDTILEAANLLKNERYSFYLLGGNKYRMKKWRNYIAKHNIKGDIQIMNFKPHSLIPYYLKAADVLLVIYSKSLYSQEYMSPVKLFEYMAAKVPIIATKIGRNIEICNNNECLFTNLEDPKDLSEKIKLLINNRDLQGSLIQNAYQKVKNYTIQDKCEKILKFFF